MIFNCKIRVKIQNLISLTYVVCERLSVMHEPAGVVENLVQILQNGLQNTPPPKLKFVTESKSKYRIPPPKLKFVTESKSKYRIPLPPQN